MKTFGRVQDQLRHCSARRWLEAIYQPYVPVSLHPGDTASDACYMGGGVGPVADPDPMKKGNCLVLPREWNRQSGNNSLMVEKSLRCPEWTWLNVKSQIRLGIMRFRPQNFSESDLLLETQRVVVSMRPVEWTVSASYHEIWGLHHGNCEGCSEMLVHTYRTVRRYNIVVWFIRLNFVL